MRIDASYFEFINTKNDGENAFEFFKDVEEV